MPYVLTLIFLAAALWLNHAAIALILGILLSYVIFIPEDFFTNKYGTKILQTGIVFLGAVSYTHLTLPTNREV